MLKIKWPAVPADLGLESYRNSVTQPPPPPQSQGSLRHLGVHPQTSPRGKLCQWLGQVFIRWSGAVGSTMIMKGCIVGGNVWMLLYLYVFGSMLFHWSYLRLAYVWYLPLSCVFCCFFHCTLVNKYSPALHVFFGVFFCIASSNFPLWCGQSWSEFGLGKALFSYFPMPIPSPLQLQLCYSSFWNFFKQFAERTH